MSIVELTLMDQASFSKSFFFSHFVWVVHADMCLSESTLSGSGSTPGSGSCSTPGSGSCSTPGSTQGSPHQLEMVT